MLYQFRVNTEMDKLLVGNIIECFLDGKSYDEIGRYLNRDAEFIKWILKYKKMIIDNFGENVWEKVNKKNNNLLKREKEARKAAEYEQTMDNVIYYMINSLYNYDELAEKLFMSKKNIQEMALNFQYIESKYGKKILKKLKKAIEIRKTLHYSHRDKVIVKDPKYRNIVCSNVINVSSYQYSLIEKVALFFEFNGDTQKMALNSEYSLNSIVASLNDISLSDILISSAYERLKKLLELDSILTQNKLTERNELIKKVVTVSYGVNGDAESLTEILGYPIGAIERILSNPYVSIVCKSLKIDKYSIEIKYNDSLSENPKVKVNKIEN